MLNISIFSPEASFSRLPNSVGRDTRIISTIGSRRDNGVLRRIKFYSNMSRKTDLTGPIS